MALKRYKFMFLEAPGDEDPEGTDTGGADPTAGADAGGGEGKADATAGGDTEKGNTAAPEEPGTDSPDDADKEDDAGGEEKEDKDKKDDEGKEGEDPTISKDDGAEPSTDEEEDPHAKVQDSILRQKIHDEFTHLKDQCEKMETLSGRSLYSDIVNTSAIKGIDKIKSKFTETQTEITRILEYYPKFSTEMLKQMLDLIKERVKICVSFMNEFIDTKN